jgi:hypothetical protein
LYFAEFPSISFLFDEVEMCFEINQLRPEFNRIQLELDRTMGGLKINRDEVHKRKTDGTPISGIIKFMTSQLLSIYNL